MEKIIIAKITKIAKQGKTPFWACETNDNKKYTVWDDKLAKTIEQRLNIESEAEIKQSGDFWNIRYFGPLSQDEPVQAIAKQLDDSQSFKPSQPRYTQNRAYSRDNSIIAQCLFKGAVELINNDDEKDFEVKCNKAIHAVVGMYNKILVGLD